MRASRFLAYPTGLLLAGLALPSCGGGSPGPGPTPVTPTHTVTVTVFYDENGDGTMQPTEVGRVPGVEVQVGGRTIEVAQPAMPGETVRVCLRPEDVTLLAPEPADRASSARNRLTGKVVRVVPSGPHLRVSVDCGFVLAALVTHRSAESLRLGEGVPISAQFKATALHLLRPGGGHGAAAASLDTATRGGV